MPFVAGAAFMRPSHFMFYNLVGGVGWVALCMGAGMLFGNVPMVKGPFLTGDDRNRGGGRCCRCLSSSCAIESGKKVPGTFLNGTVAPSKRFPEPFLYSPR
jgi:hypothetical protein